MFRWLAVCGVVLGSATARADGNPSLIVPWSESVIDRPLTLPTNNVAVYGDLDVFRFDSNGLKATSEVLHGGVGYGVSEKMMFGLDYALNLHTHSSFTALDGTKSSSSDSFPGNGRGPLIPYVSFRLAHDRLSAAMSFALVANLAGDVSIDTMNGVTYTTTYTTTYAITAGIVLKYNVTPKFALYTGAPFGGSGVGFAGSPFGPGPLGNQITTPLTNDVAGNALPTTLVLPIGAGFQITPQLFGFVQTTLLLAYISNTPKTAENPGFIGVDTPSGGIGAPLTAGAFFSFSHAFEIGATVSFPDLEHAGGLYLFGLAARLYGD